ncbi:MAG: GWxTD domain-containing protein [bacterium]|nr:GWxTD domain-containing protein [bacterium]
MKKNLLVSVSMIFSVIFLGCGGKLVKIDPNDPVEKYKEENLLRDYGFFVNPAEKKELQTLKTIAEVDIFIHKFWWGDKLSGAPSRDPDPNTIEHELKDTIDQRIRDIKNEIFTSDTEIPLTRFDRSGGLKGDLAHVYLLYGTPHFKAKLSQSTNHVELMVWYYFDFQGKPIFKFLFYDNYGTLRLFRGQMLARPENLMDPQISPLKEISNRFISKPEELYEVWRELELQDPEWIFIGALLQFSYYSDVVIQGGNEKRLGALDPPQPAGLTAAKFKPTISGQPDDLTGREFINSSHGSLIPAELIITEDNRPSFSIVVGYKDIDWEVRGDKAEFVLDLRISFQHKTTKNIKEYSVRLLSVKTREEVKLKARNSVTLKISIDDIKNFAQLEEPRQNLHQLVESLEPGTYVVNIDLRHPDTKKSAGGWREEIVIK